MTEHTHTAEVDGSRYVRVPDNWPVGAEVTVTWTEPPEPSGRWVVTDGAGGEMPFWDDGIGDQWSLTSMDCLTSEELERAEAALVDLIESDHLPPQMPSVDDIDDWLVHNGFAPFMSRSHCRAVIRGTLDYFAAKAAHGRTGS